MLILPSSKLSQNLILSFFSPSQNLCALVHLCGHMPTLHSLTIFPSNLSTSPSSWVPHEFCTLFLNLLHHRSMKRNLIIPSPMFYPPHNHVFCFTHHTIISPMFCLLYNHITYVLSTRQSNPITYVLSIMQSCLHMLYLPYNHIPHFTIYFLIGFCSQLSSLPQFQLSNTRKFSH